MNDARRAPAAPRKIRTADTPFARWRGILPVLGWLHRDRIDADRTKATEGHRRISMTSPFALLLSIAGTVCMFILALIGIIADATIAPTPAVGAALAPSTVAVIAQAVSHGDPVPYTVAQAPAASRAATWGR
jgi:hypothetical protein